MTKTLKFDIQQLPLLQIDCVIIDIFAKYDTVYSRIVFDNLRRRKLSIGFDFGDRRERRNVEQTHVANAGVGDHTKGI